MTSQSKGMCTGMWNTPARSREEEGSTCIDQEHGNEKAARIGRLSLLHSNN
jgi:hypothetical protein